MLGSENISLVFRRKLLAVIESNPQRGVVWMKDHIRRDDFVLQFGVLAVMSRVLVSAHVPPGPAVKAALLHMGNVIRNQIVPQRVAFVHRTPQHALLSLHPPPAATAA